MSAESAADIVHELLAHRLHQSDIRALLQRLEARDRHELEEKIGAILQKVSALIDVSSRVSDALELDVVLDRVLDVTTEAVNGERGTIFLHDDESDDLYSRVALGGVTEQIRFPSHLGLAGAVFKSGVGVIIDDAYADPRFNQEVDRRSGYRTQNLLCAPIRAVGDKHAVIGVAQVLNKKTGAFTGEDLHLLEAICGQAARALLNAQLFERVRRAARDETRILELATAVSSELRLRPLLQRIMQTTTDLLDADRSTLFLNDDKTGQLWSEVAEGLGVQELRFPNDRGIAGHVFTTGQTVNLADAYDDPRFNRETDRRTGYRTHSLLCTAVTNKAGKRIGVVQVLNRRGGAFTAQDEQRLRAFSSQASVAIENAKLFDEVENLMQYNESMLQSLSNGILTLDEDGCIVKTNAAARRILHTDEDRLLGARSQRVFEGRNAWVQTSIERVVQTGKPDTSMDATLERADGGHVATNLTVVPLVSVKREESHIGSMVVIDDITTEKRVKSTMARYMSKELAERLLAAEDNRLGGQMHLATVLFSDIRGFTTLTERLGAQATVSLLNDYFSVMVDIVMLEGGILDKYIGDAIMAVFGAPFPTEDDADRAVRAGISMLRALREHNVARKLRGEPPIRIGIGVHTDEVVSGNIGSLKRMEYTVIGDGVNLASRLESATKYYGAQMLLSEATRQQLRGSYQTREIDLIAVKGKTHPVPIHEVLDPHDESTFPHRDEVVSRYRDGLQQYRQRRFADALASFETALAANPGDQPSRLYLERCRFFLENPPETDWSCVWVMETK